MKQGAPVHLAWWRVALIISCTVGIAILSSILVIKPVQQRIADRYAVRADADFVAGQYAQAQANYTKSLSYNPELESARTNRALAEQASTNPNAALSFFAQHNAVIQLGQLQEAMQQFADPKQALIEGVKLYQAGSFSYAQYPLKKATELDPQYAEAWNYLGLTYQELAKVDSSFTERATSAFAARDHLTSKYLTP